VRILLRLRKEFADLPVAPTGQDDGARMENTEKIPESDIASEKPQSVEVVKNLKMKERSWNVHENKGSDFDSQERAGGVAPTFRSAFFAGDRPADLKVRARKQTALSSGEKEESNSEFRVTLAPSLPLSVGSRQPAVGSKGSGS
jgi:hypothetical protein